MKKRMVWPRMKSAANMPSSVILHTNSRPGCDMECQPIEYHLPVHQAMLDESCLNSRVSANAMISLKMKRCRATTAIMPSKAFVKLQPSRKNMTSKNASSIMTAKPWAIAASTDPNFLQHILRIGPIQQAMPNRPARTPALIAIGANATSPTRMSEFVAFWGCKTPVCALMNRYGMSVKPMSTRGPTTSLKKMLVKCARGTSPDSFSEGFPRTFRLKPVMRVLDNLQKAIHDESCERELPRDIQRRKSR